MNIDWNFLDDDFAFLDDTLTLLDLTLDDNAQKDRYLGDSVIESELDNDSSYRDLIEAVYEIDIDEDTADFDRYTDDSSRTQINPVPTTMPVVSVTPVNPAMPQRKKFA